MRKRLRKSIDTVAAKLEAYDFSDPRKYALFLSQAYYFVKHSTPMLALSCGLSVNDRPYHIRCIEHLSEEKGHDKMLLNDLKFMGFKPEDFQELAATKALYQTQYYWIEHIHPSSFLGYISLLEGLAVVSGAKIKKRIDNFGGKSFLKNHADDDVGHLEKAFAIIEQFPPEQQELIAQNCEQAASLYISMLDSMSLVQSIAKAG